MNFAEPAWLALLLLLLLIGAMAILVVRLRRKQWDKFVAPRLRQVLLKRSSSLPRWIALLFLLAACTAITVALARPQGDAGTKTEKTQGRNVMIALDISRSMRVGDVSPDRLTQAKVMIYELLESMPNERIGFIGFAGTAYLYAPLTIDHAAVRETIEQIDETWAPVGGSDLAASILLATETLKKTGQKNNALIILSDGEEINDLQQEMNLDDATAEAERSGVYIVTIGVGTENGGYIPNPNFPDGQTLDRSGRPVISRLHSNELRKLAESTKGRFAVAGSGLDIPELVKSVVADLDEFEMEGRERKISIEFYQWLLLPGIAFLMISIIAGTRWKGIQAALLIIGVVLTTNPSRASDASNAKEALVGERYEEARDAYRKLAEESRFESKRARYRLGEAAAAYRAQDFRAARTAFSQSLLSQDSEVRANGHLGIGNSLFQLGWKGLSGENYPTDPASIPDLNRYDTIVKEALAKMRESESSDENEEASSNLFEPLITNWADSVRHYQSALALNSSDQTARKNSALTMVYLKRLRELLREEKEETEQSMGQGQPGEGPPQEGDGKEEGDEEGDGKGKKKGDKDSKDGDGEKQKNDGRNGPPKKDEEGGDKKNKNKGDNPNESAEERANRILKENADTEKGPLSPGRREFQDAEKDW